VHVCVCARVCVCTCVWVCMYIVYTHSSFPGLEVDFSRAAHAQPTAATP